MVLKGRKILLGVCGSIAAYKAAILVRLLVKHGAEVRVVMTRSAAGFVGPLTFSTLSKNPALIEFSEKDEQVWNNHVELGLWADVMLIAPASANTIAKLANGLCDNLLCATYLSARCPVLIAPAMDIDMWQHLATQRNIQMLSQAGNQIIPVGSGELASGLWGDGRLAEPEEILNFLILHFSKTHQTNSCLQNKNLLITAGPTYEPIDPVRFVGNRSSGIMGIALTKEALLRGASVCLVMGPTSQPMPQHPNLNIIHVETAEEMFQACVVKFEQTDIAILAAAVSDYTPTYPQTSKIKKHTDEFNVVMHKTKDILAHLGNIKRKNQILAGFALETDNEIENAFKKVKTKNLDFVVLNSLKDEGAGFKHATNKITIIDKSGNQTPFPLKNKNEVAKDILDKVCQLQKSI
ncbi:MAG: bifunctional phosphopantothenoylcysteine decarboxylase/phosphopantothenate--cysteine ligase CoaBC [Sphingobacteriales bacterium]|nr:MAG: bifunctional phosphopantothenoylcysteine decarboxylase/phosphopantothenate--cysteine ligase CoaBC [Sphingobacteriales bacterium]